MVNKLFYKIILIVILVLVICYLSFNSTNYSCDKCSITFKNNRILGMDIQQTIKINMTDLFSSYSDGLCMVRWSRTNGYITV